MSIMSPPRPVLADLPLDLFLNPTPNLNRQTSFTRSKRSRSPSLACSIFNPAKRRILEQEGLVLTTRSRLRTRTSTDSLDLPRRALLHVSETSKRLPGPSIAKGDTPPPTLVHPDPLDPPSPRAPRRTSPRLSASPHSKSCSSATTTPPRSFPRKARPETAASGSSSRYSRRTTPSTPTVVPREMPPPPDRRSLHYPGFDVHQDTHIALPSTQSMTRRALEEAARAQEGEAAKENVRPATGSGPCKSSNAKGDTMPRRSARLRANNRSTLQGAILDVRGRESCRTTLYGVSLKV